MPWAFSALLTVVTRNRRHHLDEGKNMTALFVVATIIVFLSVDWLIQRLKHEEAPRQPLALKRAVYPLRIPDGVFFAKSHTWLNLFPSGKIRLGVDDFIGSLLENPQVCLIKQVGESVEKGEPIMTLTEGEHFLTVRSPLSGEIASVNDALEDDSSALRESLFSRGWAYTIIPRHPEEVRSMMLGDETRNWMSREFQRMRDLLAGVGANGTVVPATIQDGGAPVAGALRHLDDPDAWKRFEDEFLQVR
jgi:glycine cleavage system H protein